jgi:hypothetical protein
MNFEEKTVQILDFILQSLQAAKDFTIEQAPDVVRQLLAYDMIACFESLMWWGILIPVAYLMYRWIKLSTKRKWYNQDECEGAVPNVIASVVVSVVLFILVICNSVDTVSNIKKVIQIKCTPKAYLIHTITDLAKDKQK